MRVTPLGDSAVLITLGDQMESSLAAHVRALAAELTRHPLPGTTDVVPAFAAVAIFFEPGHPMPAEMLRAEVQAAADRVDAAVVTAAARVVEIPVCYGGEFGPDLGAVAERAKCSASAVIERHAARDYEVHAVGFVPGFPYLGGLDPELATPRLPTPRAVVPAGSVGIGGSQTGVYPMATPGGWNLIGRTPLRLFDPARKVPALLEAGDRVRFRPIGTAEFFEVIRALESPGEKAAPRDDVRPGLTVLKPGLFTTVQDLGRRGHRAEGVPQGGAADPLALRLANLLVGNAEGAPALEFTLMGPELRFERDTVIALTGGDFGSLPRWLPTRVRAGSVLRLGPAASGCRGYLAVAGGLDIANVLGSASTFVRAGLGGVDGRALREGDVLPFPDVSRHLRGHWTIDERILPDYSRPAEIRVIPGDHADEFPGDWTNRTFTVSAHSDRMGVRLQGPALSRKTAAELLSAPVAPGTVQVPPDGQPIVLLADAQTIGGYPRLAHVISVDLPRVAQLRPGETVTFRRVTLVEAREIHLAQERALGLLREGVAQKLA